MPRKPFFTITRFLTTAAVVLATSAHGETLLLTNGKQAEVRLLRPTAEGAEVDFQGSQRLVPWKEIKAIHWPNNPEEAAAIAAVQGGAPLVRVMDLWTAKKPWLARPNSDAGQVGLVYAAELAKRTLAEERTKARSLYQEILQHDWLLSRREASQLALWRMDLADGKREAVSQAVALLTHQASAALKIDARHELALALISELKALQKEHPRWELEEDVTRQRMAIYHQIPDLLLYPVLFHGTDDLRCRRALKLLADFYSDTRETAKAEAVRQDLRRLYPESEK